MKIRLMLLALMTMACPLVARGQDAATRPAEMSAAPATRPALNSSRYDNYRTNRRYDRRSNQSSQTAAAALPAIYDAVAARDIFIKGDQHPAPPPPVVPTVAIDPRTAYSASASQLVLTGVSLEDNTQVGFLEDQQAGTVTRVKIGDSIANGKIVNITIEALDYKDPNGNIIRVQVGFNLAGGDVWGVANAQTGGSSTQPSLTGPRGPGESMENYLKRRRAAELGH